MKFIPLDEHYVVPKLMFNGWKLKDIRKICYAGYKLPLNNSYQSSLITRRHNEYKLIKERTKSYDEKTRKRAIEKEYKMKAILAKKADELQPNNISINDTLGWIYAGRKEFKQALSYLEKANQISRGKNPNVLYHLAFVQNKMGDSVNAKANVKKALSIANNFESKHAAEQLLSRL